MIYYKVKESIESEFTDGVDSYSIHETNVGVENPIEPEKNLFIGESIEEAMSHFGLIINKKNTENETI